MAVYTSPDEIEIAEGSSMAFTLRWTGATAISSPTSKILRGNQDVSADWMTGSNSAAGIVQTTKTIAPPTGSAGKNFVLQFTAVIDSLRTEVRWTRVRVPRVPR